MIITIDGPSGTGKSTVAKLVAKELGFTYFDTGAMYRSLTQILIQKGIQPDEQEKIEEILSDFLFEIRTLEDGEHYFANGEDVSDPIRGRKVTQMVSVVAALPFVREKLVSIQRMFSQNTDGVFEGRDLGTVVFPQADQKFFITADAQVRAERRYHQLLEKDPSLSETLSIDEIEKDINERDLRDTTRKVSPLKPAEDAQLMDTSQLSITEVVKKIVGHVKQHS